MASGAKIGADFKAPVYAGAFLCPKIIVSLLTPKLMFNRDCQPIRLIDLHDYT